MIPDDAVEAAARSFVAAFYGAQEPTAIEVCVARLALEDAAPHMQPAVTSEDDLGALPIGSVVLSKAYHSDVNGDPISFQRWHDGQWRRGGRSASTHPDNFLPVTVLHMGTIK